MRLFITNPSTHTSFAVTCNDTDSILQLKKTIQEKENISTLDQHLSYQHKPLRDSESLKAYGISDQSTLSLLARMRGGMKTKDNDMTDHQKKPKKKSTKKSPDDDIRPQNNELLPQGYKTIEDLRISYQRQKKDITDKDLCIHEYKTYECKKDGCPEGCEDENCPKEKASVKYMAASQNFRYCFVGTVESVIMYDLETKSHVHLFEKIHTGSSYFK